MSKRVGMIGGTNMSNDLGSLPRITSLTGRYDIVFCVRTHFTGTKWSMVNLSEADSGLPQ
jgi:hypothetical protein